MWKILNFLLIVIVCIEFAHLTSAEEEKLITHYACKDFPSQTQIIGVTIGPCADGAGCVMPDCCGLISGAQSHFSIRYTASIAIDDATTHPYVNALNPNDPRNNFTIGIETTEIPRSVISYDREACKYMDCPQYVDREYLVNTTFTIPTTVLTSVTLVGKFGAHFDSKAEGTPIVACAEVFARFVPAEFESSLKDTLTNPIVGVELPKLPLIGK